MSEILILTGPVEFRQHFLTSCAALADRSDLLGQVLHPRAAGALLGGIAGVEALEVVVELGVGELDELGQRRPREIAVLVVHRLDPRAVYRQQLAAEQVQLPAQQHELTEHRTEGLAVVAAEIGDGLEVGLQMPQQPDHLDVAVGLGFKPPAGSDPIEVAVDVELEQIGGRVAGPPGLLRPNTTETCGR